MSAHFSGCGVGALSQDPQTETLTFYSSCNPFKIPNYIGAQLFAIATGFP